MSDLLYRKKPVVIEAMQFQPVGSSGEDAARVESWCGGEMVVGDQGYCLVIKTLEGRMRASPGDWIIKGVAGEFYPCKPDIFEKTYESATLPAVQPDAGSKPFDCECGQVGPCKAQFCTPRSAVQPDAAPVSTDDAGGGATREEVAEALWRADQYQGQIRLSFAKAEGYIRNHWLKLADVAIEKIKGGKK